MKKWNFLKGIVSFVIVFAMLVSLAPLFTASAVTSKKSTAYKQNKTVYFYLTGKESRNITFASDIAKIKFGSQTPVIMKKVSARKVRVAGVRNGKTSFVAVTKDNRRIVCNVIRSHTLRTAPRSRQVINTWMKVKAVKSYNTSIANIAMSKDRKSYTVATTAKKGNAKIAVKYANDTTAYITVINHTHTWVDTPVYEEQPVYETRDKYETQDVYETRDKYETQDVYETRDKYETQDVYKTRDKYETQDVYEDQPIYEEHTFNNGVDVDAATADFNATHGTNYEYGDRYFVEDFAAYLANLGATSGRTYSDWVQVGTEKVKTGTKKVKVGTEKVKTGTKKVKVGTEKVKTGTKKVKVGTEKVKTGTKKVKVGTERVKTGTKKVQVGTKRTCSTCGAIQN